MKKIIAMVALVFSCMLAYAQTNGEVIVMNKAMFIKDVFDYEKSQDWKYKGNKPAIIDLYADWCGPCRMVAPIMKELAKEYADKIVVYKVNVDKESVVQCNKHPSFCIHPYEWRASALPRSSR